MRAQQAPKHSGISFLEMTIVLTIIALIMGSMLAVQGMIKQAELRSLVEQVNAYKAATSLFREKFLYYPGDLPSAEEFWGADTLCPNTTTNETVKPETCDGNGDGKVYDAKAQAERYETFRYWQHLANAGFIEGSYSGVTGSGSSLNPTVGMNVPKTEIIGGALMMMYIGVYDAEGTTGDLGAEDYFDGDYGHALHFHKDTIDFSNSMTSQAEILTADDAYYLDNKFDDGFASSGYILGNAQGFGSGSCGDGEYDDLAVEYDFSTNEVACVMLFLMDM